jgi:hypothetical protein
VIHIVRRMRVRPGAYLEPLCFSVLSTLVAWFVPEAVQFDERDPVLGAGFEPGHPVL